MTRNIALGVGKGNLGPAADFYENVMGMRRGEANGNWIEMISGPQRLYLIDDENGTPTFEIQVEDVGKALDLLLASGCVEESSHTSPKERYVKTPYGHYFCISSA